LTPVASAQTITTGEIAGTIMDPSGAVVANATTTLKSDATGETQTATSNGLWGQIRFPLLRPGSYTLTTVGKGFADTTLRVTVNLGQITSLPIQLTLRAEAQTVSVTEATGLIQVDNANLATTFDNSQLVNLPAPGNDMTAYAFSAPGVTISTGGGLATSRRPACRAFRTCSPSMAATIWTRT
jgi:hypothetical protein